MVPKRSALLVAGLAALVPAGARGDVPAAVVERPSTLPGGMLQLDAALAHESRRALGVSVLDAQTLTLAVGWGVTSHLELGLDASARVHPDAHWVRETTPALAWRVFEAARLDVTPTVRAPLFADHGYDVGTHVDLGLGLRWRVADRVLVSFGRTLTSLDFRPVVAWHLRLDADIGVQLTRTLEIDAALGLGELTMAGPIDRSSAPWDALPVVVRAVWAGRPGLDAVATLGSTALQQGDDLAITLGVAVRP